MFVSKIYSESPPSITKIDMELAASHRTKPCDQLIYLLLGKTLSDCGNRTSVNPIDNTGCLLIIAKTGVLMFLKEIFFYFNYFPFDILFS